MTLSDTRPTPVTDDDPVFMSVGFVAKTLGLPVATVRGQLCQPVGPLPIERIGRGYFIPAESVRQYVDSITSRSA